LAYTASRIEAATVASVEMNAVESPSMARKNKVPNSRIRVGWMMCSRQSPSARSAATM
jgi:hypothetical protein